MMIQLTIIVLALLASTLDGLQRPLKISSAASTKSGSLPSRKANTIPSEWKKQDWGKLERSLKRPFNEDATDERNSTTIRSTGSFNQCKYVNNSWTLFLNLNP